MFNIVFKNKKRAFLHANKQLHHNHHNDAKQFSKKIDFAQYGKNTVKLLQYNELLVKLLQIWCQVLKNLSIL